jgi:hypothetical protein
VWGSKDLMYYYKDFVNKKIRVIFLNTSDNNWSWLNDGTDYLAYDPLLTLGIRQQQADWLINTALNFSDKSDKADWHTMVVCHVPLFSEAEGMKMNGLGFSNDDSIKSILQAFKIGSNTPVNYTDSTYAGLFNLNLTANFVSQGSMNLIGVWSGHCHLDNIVTANGFTNVSTTSGYADPNISSYITRTIGQYSEFAFDVVTVDKSTRTVTLKRFGAGNDRNFTY